MEAAELTLTLCGFLSQNVISVRFAVFIAAGGLAKTLRGPTVGLKFWHLALSPRNC